MEAESAAAALEVVQGDPQIQENPVHAREPELRKNVRQLSEIFMNEPHPVGIRRQNDPGVGDGIRVLVEADQMAVRGACFQNGPGVARAAEGAVHVDPARPAVEVFQHLRAHDRDVAVRHGIRCRVWRFRCGPPGS